MRIPFITRKPEDVESIVRRATRVGSAEVPWPRLSQDKTLEDTRRARARINARRNGPAPS
jgi:hypothetical protein